MTTPMPSPEGFRFGFVGMAGAPNAGKSTLVNRLVGQKVSIATRCPQTTRHRVCGIMNEPGTQAVLVDVPGILPAESAFNQALVETARTALRDCDLILHIRAPELCMSDREAKVIETLERLRRPVWQIWNKIDAKRVIPAEAAAATPLPYEATYFISALTGQGLPELKEGLCHRLPLGPALYPEDDLSDRDLRFLAAEMVREKAFLHLQQEVPHALAAWTEIWEERPGGGAFIRVIIQTEREAHKSIIIGAGGSMLKKIGTAARRDIEDLCGHPVFLELKVQVRAKWRSNPSELERLGLSVSAKRG